MSVACHAQEEGGRGEARPRQKCLEFGRPGMLGGYVCSGMPRKAKAQAVIGTNRAVMCFSGAHAMGNGRFI